MLGPTVKPAPAPHSAIFHLGLQVTGDTELGSTLTELLLELLQDGCMVGDAEGSCGCWGQWPELPSVFVAKLHTRIGW